MSNKMPEAVRFRTLSPRVDTPTCPSVEGLSRLSITVVFTTIPDTLEALRAAASMASQLGASIRVLVPTVVPYHLDVERPRADPLFRLRHFRTLCADHAVHTWIDVRLCRDSNQCIHEALHPHSVVLISKRKSWWPFNSARRLVKTLREDGHEVIEIRRQEA